MVHDNGAVTNAAGEFLGWSDDDRLYRCAACGEADDTCCPCNDEDEEG